MKGFSSGSFAEVLSKGLRPFAENKRSDVGLLECHNLCPAEKGLELHEQIYSINSGSWGSGVPWIYLQDAAGVLVEGSGGEPVEVVL